MGGATRAGDPARSHGEAARLLAHAGEATRGRATHASDGSLVRGREESHTAAGVTALRALFSGAPVERRGAHDVFARWLAPRYARPALTLASALGRERPGFFDALGRLSLGLSDNVALRTLRIDAAIDEAAAAGRAAQLVLLGAGFDARAYRLSSLAGARVFEVDHPNTQREKRARLIRRRPLARELIRVAVDFERDSLDRDLLYAGFDPRVPAVWVWEGVTMYLTASARRQTERAVARIAAPESQFLTTYLPPDRVTGRLRRGLLVAAHVLGEPILGTVTATTLHHELQTDGWEITEDQSAEAWARRFWAPLPRPVAPWENLLVAVKIATDRGRPGAR